MTVLNRIVVLVVALILSGCVESPIPHDVACAEQAAAWCARASRSDCDATFVGWCSLGNQPIDAEWQGWCLDAIDESPYPDQVPFVCVRTWGE